MNPSLPVSLAQDLVGMHPSLPVSLAQDFVGKHPSLPVSLAQDSVDVNPCRLFVFDFVHLLAVPQSYFGILPSFSLPSLLFAQQQLAVLRHQCHIRVHTPLLDDPWPNDGEVT